MSSRVDSWAVPSSGASSVQLGIYGPSGRLVREWRLLSPTGGEHRIAWDSTDGEGRRVDSGVYFARLDVDGRTSFRKLVVLR